MNLLFMDNYDSFTYILRDYFLVKNCKVEVWRNDDINWRDNQRVQAYDGLVLSPGPGMPEDAGFLIEVVNNQMGQMPMLGVCLGHQAIGLMLGGQLSRDRPWHGKQTTIYHQKHPLFNKMPSPTLVGRYHSWNVEGVDQYSIAKTKESTCMALADDAKGVWGIQFHPESCMTIQGNQYISNFLRLAATFLNKGQ